VRRHHPQKKLHPDRPACTALPGAKTPRNSPPAVLPWLADPDLIICGKLPGIAIARVGPRHDGQCVGYACDSFVNPAVLARICDECNYGSFEGRCVITGEPGVADAYYCKECVKLEKDRDGCPKIINLGSARTVTTPATARGRIAGASFAGSLTLWFVLRTQDLFYERKKYGFKKR
jgi:PHD finger-like domain-containing protein 5A